MKIIGLDINVQYVSLAYIEGDKEKINKSKVQLHNNNYVDIGDFAKIIKTTADHFVKTYKPDKIYMLDIDMAQYATFGEFWRSPVYYVYASIDNKINVAQFVEDEWEPEMLLYPITEQKIRKILKVAKNQTIEDAAIRLLALKEEKNLELALERYRDNQALATSTAVALAGLELELAEAE